MKKKPCKDNILMQSFSRLDTPMPWIDKKVNSCNSKPSELMQDKTARTWLHANSVSPYAKAWRPRCKLQQKNRAHAHHAPWTTFNAKDIQRPLKTKPCTNSRQAEYHAKIMNKQNKSIPKLHGKEELLCKHNNHAKASKKWKPFSCVSYVCIIQ